MDLDPNGQAYTPLDPNNLPAGATKNDQGFYVDPQGDLLPGQMTPGMQANPQGFTYYDPSKDLYYNLFNGQKSYSSPYGYGAGQGSKGQGTGHGMTSPSGGFLKSNGTWNTSTGQFDQGTNWGNLLSLGIGGAIAAPFVGSALGSLFGGAGSTTPTIPAATAGSVGSTAPLASSITAPLSGALPTGLASGTGLSSLGSSMAGLLPSTITAPLTGNIPAGLASGSSLASMSGSPGLSSMLSSLLSPTQQTVSNPLQDIGKLLGSFGQAQATNRGVTGGFTQNYDRNMLQAQQDRNATESDAMKKLAQTNYILSGGSNFKLPPTLSLGGRDSIVPDLGLSPKPVSDAQKQGAATLQQQLLGRLAPGGTYTPQPLSSYTQPGAGEQAANVGSLITSGLGAAGKLFGLF